MTGIVERGIEITSASKDEASLGYLDETCFLLVLFREQVPGEQENFRL
jgi:hypothetical protein